MTSSDIFRRQLTSFEVNWHLLTSIDINWLILTLIRVNKIYWRQSMSNDVNWSIGVKKRQLTSIVVNLTTTFPVYKMKNTSWYFSFFSFISFLDPKGFFLLFICSTSSDYVKRQVSLCQKYEKDKILVYQDLAFRIPRGRFDLYL